MKLLVMREIDRIREMFSEPIEDIFITEEKVKYYQMMEEGLLHSIEKASKYLK